MTTIVFDVNETLLDLSALDTHFERVFGDAAAKGEWFKQVIQSALVATVLGTTGSTDFGQIGRMALDMVGLRKAVTLSNEDRQLILGAMLTLPPHPEVSAALQHLDDAGIRMAALTNSSQSAAETQLTNAGLARFMSRILSVQPVGKFKPAVEVYQRAGHELNQFPDELWLVAAHDWDIAGAQHARWNTAFVARPGMVIAPQARPPDIVGKDMTDVVHQLLQHL